MPEVGGNTIYEPLDLFVVQEATRSAPFGKTGGDRPVEYQIGDAICKGVREGRLVDPFISC